MNLCQNSTSFSIVNDIEELLSKSQKCFDKVTKIQNESSVSVNPKKNPIFMPEVNIGSDYEELIEFAKNVRKEVLSDTEDNTTDAASSQSSNKILGKDSPWEEIIPPIWDQYVLKDYVKGIVNVYFTREPKQSKIHYKKKEFKKSYKDKSTFVEEDKINSNENLYEINDPVEEYEIHNEIRNKLQPPSPEPTPRKPKVVPVIQPAKVILERKRPLTSSRSDNAYTERTPISQNIRSVSAPILQKSQAKPTKIQHKTSSLPKCLRFVGKSITSPVNFNKEHPDIFLEESTDTLFPRRCKKAMNMEKPDKKLLKSTLNIDNDIKDNKYLKNDKKLGKAPLSLPSSATEINKTWHEVFLVEKLKTNEPRKTVENLSSSSEGTSSPKSGRNIDKDTSVTDRRDEATLGKETMKFRDVIYDSVTTKQTPKVDNMKNYQIQNLPILCIRGECKVQKGIDISIVDIKETKTIVDGSENDDQNNVKYFQFMYDPMKQRMRPSTNEILDGTVFRRQIEANDLPESGISENNSLKLKDKAPAKLDKEYKDKSEYEKDVHSIKINKFMAPFHIQDTEGPSHTAAPENNYETSFEESSSTSLLTDVTPPHDISSQTDDEKIKSKEYETTKNSTISTSSTENIEIPDPKSIQLSKLQDNNSSDNGLHLILEESKEFVEVRTTDILNIFEEVFSCSTDTEMNENPKFNSSEIQKESHSESFSKPKKFVSIGIDCARQDDFNYYPTNARDISIQTENLQSSKEKVEEKTEPFKKLQEKNQEQENESLSNILNKIRLDNEAILERFNTLRQQVSVSTSTRPDIIVDDNGMIATFDHKVPINSNPSNNITSNVVGGGEGGGNNQHLMYMKPIKLDCGQPNIGKAFLGRETEQPAVNTNIDPNNVFRNNIEVHDDHDDNDIDYNNYNDHHDGFYRQDDGYMDGNSRTAIIGDEVENRFNLHDKRSWCCTHNSSSILEQSNDLCKCRFSSKSFVNDSYRPRYMSLSLDSIDNDVDDDDNDDYDEEDDISKILDNPFKNHQKFRHSNKYPEYRYNRKNYKKFQKSVLEQSPRFSKTIKRIYSDSAKDIFTSSKRNDPEVQRAAKKFLKSLNNGSNYYESPRNTLNRNFNESSTLSQCDHFNLESFSSSDWEFSTILPKMEKHRRKVNKMAVPITTTTTTTTATTTTTTGNGVPLTLSSTESDISIPMAASLPVQQSRRIFSTDPIQTEKKYTKPMMMMKSFNLEKNKKTSISSSQSISSGECSTSLQFNRNDLVKIGSMSEGEVLSLGEIKNFSEEEEEDI